jgi:hypothetical protein
MSKKADQAVADAEAKAKNQTNKEASEKSKASKAVELDR